MFLPLGDEPNPRGVPVVTYVLIALNCAVYVFLALPLGSLRPDFDDPLLAEYLRVIAQQLPQEVPLAELLQRVTSYDLVVFSYGFRPAAPHLTTLLTSMFLHAGFMHLAGNMLFLWIYGDNVEHRLGHVRFLIAYIVTGVAATLFHTVFDADSALPLVGASGAISGVLGFYFIWFPRNRVRLWVVLFPFFMNVIYAPARLVLGVYLVIDNLFPFFLTRGLEGGGVAYGAHIGGFIGGVAYAWLVDRRSVTARPREYRPAYRSVDWRASYQAPPGYGATPSATMRTPSEIVLELVANGEFEQAAPAYFRLSPDQTRRLLTPGHSIALGDWLANHEHPKAALTIFQRHLRDYPLGPLVAEAHLGAGLVQLRALDQPTAAYQHLVEVFDFDPRPETDHLARRALSDIATRQKFQVKGM